MGEEVREKQGPRRTCDFHVRFSNLLPTNSTAQHLRLVHFTLKPGCNAMKSNVQVKE